MKYQAELHCPNCGELVKFSGRLGSVNYSPGSLDVRWAQANVICNHKCKEIK